MYHSLAQSPRTLGALPPQGGGGALTLGMQQEIFGMVLLIGGGLLLGGVALHLMGEGLHYSNLKRKRKQKYSKSPFAAVQGYLWPALLVAGGAGAVYFLTRREGRNGV